MWRGYETGLLDVPLTTTGTSYEVHVLSMNICKEVYMSRTLHTSASTHSGILLNHIWKPVHVELYACRLPWYRNPCPIHECQGYTAGISEDAIRAAAPSMQGTCFMWITCEYVSSSNAMGYFIGWVDLLRLFLLQLSDGEHYTVRI